MYSIICLGNILMKDDSIGIILGHLLEKKNIKNPVYICETDIFSLEKAINNSSEIIIVDAIDLKLSPGDFTIIPLKGIKYSYIMPHEFVCDLKDKRGYLFGVQASSITFEMGISNELQDKLKLYLESILELIDHNKKGVL